MTQSRFRASAEQLELWLATQREPESGRFNIPLDLEFSPGVSLSALRDALDDLVDRHPALRSSFETADGELFQVVHEEAAVPLLVRRSDEAYDPEKALKAAADITVRPFDTTSAPLVRGELLLHPDGALLVLTVHHLVSDGWSQQILVDELVNSYTARVRGVSPELPPVDPAPTADPDTPDDGVVREYWSQLLSDELPSLAPIPDRNRKDTSPGAPAWAEAEVSSEVLDGVRELARAASASPATVVLASWLALVHSWSAAEEGTSGLVFAARQGDDRSIGLHARVLPLRSRIHADLPFRDLVERLRDQVLASLEHSTISSAQLRELRLERHGTKLIDSCVFMHVAVRDGEWAVPGGSVRLVDHDGAAAKYDFSLCALESRDGMMLRLDYDTTVYRRATAEVFLRQLVTLLTAAVRDGGRECGHLVASCDSFSPVRAIDPARPVEQALLHELVQRQAEARPGAIAVRHGEDALTYGELVARAGCIANWLRANNVDAEDVVALVLPPGITSIVFWLAVLMAGGAYLPLDPDYPVAQLRAMLDDAKPRVVIASADLLRRVGPRKGAAFAVEQAMGGALGFSSAAPKVDLRGDMAFNILYTSGSTGRPKGVILPHAGIVRLLQRPDFIPLDESDVLSQLCPLNFDGATYEVWGALTHGAQIIVIDKELTLSPRDLRDTFRRYGVTTMLASTPLMNRLIEDVPDLFQRLRRVYCGGEIISVPHIQRILRWAAPGTVLHGYGPTENSFTSSWMPITEVEDTARTIPIGSPVPETDVYVVLDRATMRLAPRGVPGELLLGGGGLARGYLGNPRETARRYLPDPFSGVPGARLYWTGDRVRWTPDGLLEFIGRDDNQVKIRSQRVELGEVESALSAHPAVESALVTVTVNQRGEKEIVGYMVLNQGATAAEIRQHLRQVLPVFAVPRHLIPLSELPLTPNGKVDRRRLPSPGRAAETPVSTAQPTAPSVPERPAEIPTSAGKETVLRDVLPTSWLANPSVLAVRTGVLDSVRAAWISLLDHGDFGLDDNFFDAGGHSLLLVRLAQALKEHTGKAPNVGDLLRYTTIRAQAALLSEHAGEPSAPAQPAVAPPPTPADTKVVTLSTKGTEPAHAAQEPELAACQQELAARDQGGTARILPLSARSESALAQLRHNLARHLADEPALRLDDLAVTLHRGREHFAYRYATVATSTAGAIEMLRGRLPSGTGWSTGHVDSTSPVRVTFAFGGHDDNAIAQARAAETASDVVRQWVNATGQLLETRPTSELGDALAARGPERHGLLAVFAAQYGLAEQLAARGVVPDAVTGSGVGLVTALVVSGALNFTQGLHLVNALGAALAERGEGGRSALAAVVAGVAPAEPGVRVIPSAAGITEHPARFADRLLGSADFGQLVAEAGHGGLVVDTGVGTFGPGGPGPANTVHVTLLEDPDQPERSLLAALGRLWCHGVAVDLSSGVGGRRLRLPGHPYERDN